MLWVLPLYEWNKNKLLCLSIILTTPAFISTSNIHSDMQGYQFNKCSTTCEIDGLSVCFWNCQRTTVILCLMSWGRSFQSLGAAAEKAFGDVDTGVSKLTCLPEPELYWIRSHRYLGANPWIHLNVNNRILNSIRSWIFSQCRFFRWDSTSSLRFIPLIIRAARFWRDCSCFRIRWLAPMYKPLQ